MKTSYALRAATVLLLAMPVACARPGDTAASGGDFTFPDNDAVALRVEYVGGFMTLAGLATRLPIVTIYADGRVLTDGPQIAIYPPPALPNIQVQHISADDVPKLVERALAAGVGSATDLGQPPVADAASTRITVSTADGVRTTEVYALMDAAMDGGLAPSQQEARKKLSELVGALADLRGTLGAGAVSDAGAYEPSAVAAVVSPWVSPDDAGAAGPEVAWPGPALPGKPLTAADDVSCVVAQGDAAVTVIRAAGAATSLTPWTSAGKRWTVGVRPLLPDESDCADLVD